MFNSTKDFEAAMYQILSKVKEGRTKEANFGLDLDDLDFFDALSRVIKLELVTGIMLDGVPARPFLSLSNPRLNYEGLEFIEHYELQQQN